MEEKLVYNKMKVDDLSARTGNRNIDESYSNNDSGFDNETSNEDFEKFERKNESLIWKIARHMDEDPTSPEIQKMISEHYENLKHLHQPNLGLYRGLATLYVEDGRFASYFRKYDPNLPEFMHDAMIAFCELHED